MTDREIINYIPILIYGLEYNPALGPQTGGIAYCNKSTLEFTNYTEEEIVSKGFDIFKEFIHPDDLHKTTQTVSLLLKSELDEHCEFFRVKVPNQNTYIYMKVFCKIIRPIQKNGIVKFIVTSLNAGHEEMVKHYSN
jgi:PAS domain S-box-containing protein